MTIQKRIRVAIVDDNELVTSGYSMFLGTCDDLELVGTAIDGSEAIRLCTDPPRRGADGPDDARDERGERDPCDQAGFSPNPGDYPHQL